jgi:hypothetical protein
MASRFLHIGFSFVSAPDLEELEGSFDRALDWYRYATNCWVVWTSSSPETWYTRLKKHLAEGDRVFICELHESERSGWMPRRFWEFMKSHQEQEQSDDR